MTESARHPAIFAGLLGSAAWGVPKLAFASPLEEVAQTVGQSLLLQFVIGCGIGFAAAGTAMLVMRRLSADGRDGELAEGPAAEDWMIPPHDLFHTYEEHDDDPTGDLGRFRTGQITIDSLDEPLDEAQARMPKHGRRPRHRAPATPARAAKRAHARRTGRHFEPPSQSESLVASIMASPLPMEASLPRGKHFAGPKGKHFAGAPVAGVVARPARAVPTSDTTRQSSPAVASDAAAVQEGPSVARGRARLAGLPRIEDAPVAVAMASGPAREMAPSGVAEASQAPARRTVQGESSSQDAPEREQGTRTSLRALVVARTRGVREVLADRLGADALEGVPLIPRADGTSVDVTPSWFDKSLVPALASITGAMARLEDTASRDAESQEETQPVVQPVAAAAGVEEASRASYIARHVAEVNVGMFPERRSADELEHEDAWEEALAAMGESIRQNAPVFQDVVGGPSTIDDPDGLEAPTGFIPFRVPAAHPEVVDTESYIDYLLREELSRNSSQTLRRSSRSYLRVIEGGTSPMRLRRRASETGPVAQGRHFARPRYAQEA